METNPPNPFKGLRPYGQEDQDKLFGRDRDLILMKHRIFSARTTLLFAGSGVGKTSFLNAKVIPELEQQYCVISHNRWTGADEQEDAHPQFVDEPSTRVWPPAAWLRDLLRMFRSKSAPDPAPQDSAVTQDKSITAESKISAAVRQTITQSLRPNSLQHPRRLSDILAVFKKPKPLSGEEEPQNMNVGPPPPGGAQALVADKPEKERCILILDQFEEIFQYHSYEQYFTDFIKEICDIINDDEYQVRVVFSMREEFLGELSVFDNRIADLFGNYYRLKHPDKDEAKDIITLTCALSGVKPDKEKLTSLVEDLSKLEKGVGSFTDYSAKKKRKTQVIKRNFVAPPYLQIACDRLWTEQYQKPVTEPATPPPVWTDEATATFVFAPFLTDYVAGGDEANGQAPGGGAQQALRRFCEEKLSAPFLNRTEQDLVARAFGFLVTKQGAKMAYELTSLADHMDEHAVEPLQKALEKLSRPDARILRESRGPDRSYWFELYHDMYATIVDEWKRGYQKLKKKTDQRRLALQVSIPALAIVLLFAFLHWVSSPLKYRSTLIQYRAQLERPHGPQSLSDADAAYAYQNLADTLGYRGYAQSLWADVLEQRALQFEQAGDRNRAVLTLVKAATLRSASERRADYQRAEALMSDDLKSVQNTYGPDALVVSLSPDGKRVLVLRNDKTVTLYEAGTSSPLVSFCENCSQALFTNDGKAVITLSEVGPEPVQPRVDSENNKKEGVSGVQNQNRGNKEQGRQPTARVDSEKNKVEASGSQNQKRGTGEQGSDSTAADNASTSAASKAPPRFAVQLWKFDAGVSVSRSVILANPTVSPKSAQKRNSEEAAVPSQEAENAASEQRARSPKLRGVIRSESSNDNSEGSGYLIVGTLGDQIVIWQSDTGAVLGKPVSLLEGGLNRNILAAVTLLFSPDGRFMAASAPIGSPRIFKLTDKGAAPVPQIKDLFPGKSFAFSPDGKSFLAAHKDKVARLWNLDSGVAQEIGRVPKVTKVAFSRSGHEFVAVTREGRQETAETFATATLRTLYQPLKLNGISSRIELGPDAKSLLRVTLTGGTSGFERWDLENRQQLGHLALPGRTQYAVFGADGKSVIALNAKTARSWSIDSNDTRGIALNRGTEITFRQMSDDGGVLLTGSTVDGSSREQLWDAASGKLIFEISPGDTQDFSEAILSRDGRCVAVLTNKKPVGDSQVSSDSISGPASKPVAAVPDDWVVSLWQADNYWQKTELRYDSEIDGSTRLAFSPDNKLLALSTAKKEIVVSPVGSASVLARLKAVGRVETLVFSPDNKYLLASQDPFEDKTPVGFQPLRLLNLTDGKEVSLAGNIPSELTVLSSTSRMITWGADNVARLWDLTSGAQTRDFNHDAKVGLAEFSPDGKLAVTADENGVIRLWDVSTGARLDEEKLAAEPDTLRFSNDGHGLCIHAGVWLHRLLIGKEGLQYLGGIIPGEFVEGSLYFSSDNQRTRVVRAPSKGMLEVFTTDLSPGASTPSFAGEPEAILKSWQERLGLTIGDFGRIAPLTTP